MNGRERGKLLRDAVFAEYEKRAEDRRPNRIRPSELGHECSRYLWYRFRWADTFETFEGRMHRLFGTGHSQEDRLLADLRMVGAEVFARDPENAKEQIGCELLNGHMKGFLDGVARNVPYSNADYVVAECKSHSDKSFAGLQRDGVAIAKPTHYAQMQLYMREHSLFEALYLAVNKNNDDLYFEFIEHDKRYSDNLVKKAGAIVSTSTSPPRINNNGTFFKCKMCSAHDVCHKGIPPSRSCRTCRFAEPKLHDGEAQGWNCMLHEMPLTLDKQRAGCEHHRFLPDMLAGKPYGEVQKEDVWDYIYADQDGELFYDTGPTGDKSLSQQEAALLSKA